MPSCWLKVLPHACERGGGSLNSRGDGRRPCQGAVIPNPMPCSRWLFSGRLPWTQCNVGVYFSHRCHADPGPRRGLCRSHIRVSRGRRPCDLWSWGVGDIFRPILYIGPWLLLVTLTLLPTLFVRRGRRIQVTQVEQDLPVTLELLATLAEAGLGFDAGVNRILSAQPVERPLALSFARFRQNCSPAGHGSNVCGLARRLDIGGVTTFISAVVQAEQVGSGVANVLRQQADDLRQRSRAGHGTFHVAAREADVPDGDLFSARHFSVYAGPDFPRVLQIRRYDHSTPASLSDTGPLSLRERAGVRGIQIVARAHCRLL